MARLVLSLLGPFETTLDGGTVSGFKTDKVRALLSYLAVESARPHRREVLAGLLWPDHPERAAQASLRNALSLLRKAIDDRNTTPHYLTVGRETIQFSCENDCEIDIDTLRSAATRAQSPTSKEPTGQEVAEWEAAVAHYRGPFLEGFYLKDSPAFDDWCLLTRERLQRQVCVLLQRLAEHWMQHRDYTGASRFAWRQVEIEPWHEPAQRQLMRLLALNGRRGAALSQYETCRERLAEELGVEPEADTVALYERIRDGDEIAVPASSTAATPRPRHNLPAQWTPFFGREQALSEIASRLHDPSCRLLSLVGIGGSGKTRLALEAARAQMGRYEQGVFFCSLAPLDSTAAIPHAIAQSLGFTLAAGAPPEQQVTNYLRQKNVLLILDNCEHLLIPPSSTFCPGKERAGISASLRGGIASIAAAILRAAPRVTIITTSRARLNVPGEHLVPVEGIDYPPLTPAPSPGRRGELADQTSDVLGLYPAFALFVQSARRVHPGFELTEDNRDAVVRVCQLVEGLPLVILLAATWTRLLSADEIADEIERGIDILSTEWREVPERQRSMRAVFDHSWRLLPPQAQSALARLSVFRGGFTRSIAEQVGDVSMHKLLALMNASLLQRAPAPQRSIAGTRDRYEMHELLRQYAAEKLAQFTDGGHAVRDRHSATYTTALRQWEPEIKGERQVQALAEMDVELENVRAAWLWAAEHQKLAYLQGTVEGLDRYFWTRWRMEEGISLFAQGAAHLSSMVTPDAAPEGAALRLLSKVRTAQGSLLLGPTPHNPEQSAQFCHRALDLLDYPALAGQDNRPEKAYALLTLGTAHRWSGEHPKAKQCLEQSLALYTSLGDRWGAALASRLLGDTAAALGDHKRYLALHQNAVALAEGAGDRMIMGGSLNQLRGEALRQGQIARAEELGREAVDALQELGNGTWLWWALDGLGHVLVRRGKYEQARERFAQSQALTDDLGELHGVSWAGIQLGHVEMHLGCYDRAREEGERALALCREQHILPHLGQHALLLLGSVALAEGAYAHAEALLAESIAVFRQDRGPPGLEQALAVQALSALKLGQTDMAWQRLREVVLDAGLHDFEEGLYVPRLTAALACVLLLAERGDDERASQVYALASHDPHVAHSRWFADVCEGKIAAAAPQLRGHGFARARTTIDAYGQAGDLVAVLEDVLAESGNSSAIKHSP